jgi:hypothetical protein
MEKMHHVGLFAFAGRRFLRRQQEIFKRDDFGVKIFIGFMSFVVVPSGHAFRRGAIE